MIKAPGRTPDGRPLLLLGLSAENMTRLMADEPIVIDTDQLGNAFAGMPSMAIVIVGGRTEDAIVEQLHALTERKPRP
jgi:hypothetical protein